MHNSWHNDADEPENEEPKDAILILLHFIREAVGIFIEPINIRDWNNQKPSSRDIATKLIDLFFCLYFLIDGIDAKGDN